MTRGIGLFSLCFLLLAACGNLSTNPGGTDGGDVRQTCDQCLRNVQLCVAGECVVTCVTDSQVDWCRDDETCTQALCLPAVHPTCAERPCNAEQTCVGGSCVFLQPATCSRRFDPACELTADCDLDTSRCFSPLRCGKHTRCPVGDRGGVCNLDRFGVDPLVPEWPRSVCLMGFCVDDRDCPAALHCVGGADGGVSVGECR